MPVHIFVVDETNFDICLRKGIIGIPEASKQRKHIDDGLISRLTIINKDDTILFYIKKKKELHGEFKAIDKGFFEKSTIWPSSSDPVKIFPFRIKFDNTKYRFIHPIGLSDIYDLRDRGLIWTFSLTRPTGSNSLISISNHEYKTLHNLFLIKNPIYIEPQQIREPYPYYEPNLLAQLTRESDSAPRYESTVMAYLMDSLSRGKYKNLFGEYSDYLAYIPTSFDTEMDVLLITENDAQEPMSYNIVEVKRNEFESDGLKQLLRYEDWFLKKKVNGDANMLRTSAIAKSFSGDVLEYVKMRKEYEDKVVTLLSYRMTSEGLILEKINI